MNTDTFVIYLFIYLFSEYVLLFLDDSVDEQCE